MLLKQLKSSVNTIYHSLVDSSAAANAVAQRVHKAYWLSAKNLFHYLQLRSLDLRHIQDDLSELGLSSLRTSEGYVMGNLKSVLDVLAQLSGETVVLSDLNELNISESRSLLQHTSDLFLG